MSQEIAIYEKCTQCNGTGSFTPSHGSTGSGSLPCNWPGCNATGYIEKEKITLEPGLDDILDKCSDVLEKCNDILAKLNE